MDWYNELFPSQNRRRMFREINSTHRRRPGLNQLTPSEIIWRRVSSLHVTLYLSLSSWQMYFFHIFIYAIKWIEIKMNDLLELMPSIWWRSNLFETLRRSNVAMSYFFSSSTLSWYDEISSSWSILSVSGQQRCTRRQSVRLEGECYSLSFRLLVEGSVTLIIVPRRGHSEATAILSLISKLAMKIAKPQWRFVKGKQNWREQTMRTEGVFRFQKNAYSFIKVMWLHEVSFES